MKILQEYILGDSQFSPLSSAGNSMPATGSSTPSTYFSPDNSTTRSSDASCLWHCHSCC